jgi:hypothetical protein
MLPQASDFARCVAPRPPNDAQTLVSLDLLYIYRAAGKVTSNKQ